jgi:methylphosphotriester-DNA--protein-cysteine methyltransferase
MASGYESFRPNHSVAQAPVGKYLLANQVGYESDLAFAKAFKRLLGITPTMYRKNSRNA